MEKSAPPPAYCPEEPGNEELPAPKEPGGPDPPPPFEAAPAVGFQPLPPPPPYTPSPGSFLQPPLGPRVQGYAALQNESQEGDPAPAPAQPDYLGLSVFTLLCCCLPLGIAALVYSVKTRECNKHGETFAAQRNSLMARKMNMWALGLGLCLLFIYVPLKIYLIVMQSKSHHYP